MVDVVVVRVELEEDAALVAAREAVEAHRRLRVAAAPLLLQTKPKRKAIRLW